MHKTQLMVATTYNTESMNLMVLWCKEWYIEEPTISSQINGFDTNVSNNPYLYYFLNRNIFAMYKNILNNNSFIEWLL